MRAPAERPDQHRTRHSSRCEAAVKILSRTQPFSSVLALAPWRYTLTTLQNKTTKDTATSTEAIGRQSTLAQARARPPTRCPAGVQIPRRTLQRQTRPPVEVTPSAACRNERGTYSRPRPTSQKWVRVAGYMALWARPVGSHAIASGRSRRSLAVWDTWRAHRLASRSRRGTLRWESPSTRNAKPSTAMQLAYPQQQPRRFRYPRAPGEPCTTTPHLRTAVFHVKERHRMQAMVWSGATGATLESCHHRRAGPTPDLPGHLEHRANS
jgi:hypothetical protein